MGTKKYLNKRSLVFIVIFLGIVIPSLPQIIYKNEGVSKSIGTVSNGKLQNAYKLPYSGENFRYFSAFDYYILGRCYTHSAIHKTLVDSHKEMETHYPDYTFRIMECSKRKGGRPFPHRTHQNGTSVDFMTPLKKKDKAYQFFDGIGLLRYLMKFDSRGRSRLNKNIIIDFDKAALHILTLEKHARKNGFRIKKVILETNLKDDIFKSNHGNALQKSGIYFVRSLPKAIDELHDDHYHIDFEKL